MGVSGCRTVARRVRSQPHAPRRGGAGHEVGVGRLCEGRILSDLFVSPNEQRQSQQDRAMPWRETVQFTSLGVYSFPPNVEGVAVVGVVAAIEGRLTALVSHEGFCEGYKNNAPHVPYTGSDG